jgi:tetratricopeptide (TPR) repeat protein
MAAPDAVAQDIAAQAEALYQRGLGLHRQGRPEEAQRLYEHALELEPWHVLALIFLAVICLERGLTSGRSS